MKSCSVLLLLAAGNVSIATAQPLGAFAPAGYLTTERTFHTAILLTNGKVLVAGGWATLAGLPVWASAELYDPSTGAFSATGSMTTPRTGHTATLLPDGKVLIAGGDATMNAGSNGSAQSALNCTILWPARSPPLVPWRTADRGIRRLCSILVRF
jgi:hypothetical protein